MVGGILEDTGIGQSWGTEGRRVFGWDGVGLMRSSQNKFMLTVCWNRSTDIRFGAGEQAAESRDQETYSQLGHKGGGAGYEECGEPV